MWMSEKEEDRSGMPWKGKSAAEWRMGRSPGRRSKRGRWVEGGQTNLQNVERSVVEYWGRKGRHT